MTTMQNEKSLQVETIFKMLLVVICASLYAWGGMEMKWLRRFLAPALCGVGCFIFSQDPRSLIKAPLLGAASLIGYGADEFFWKIIKRTYVALAFGLAAASYEIWKAIQEQPGLWVWIGFSTTTILLAYIMLGVWNPLPARIEESVLGLLVYTMAIMPVQKRRSS